MILVNGVAVVPLSPKEQIRVVSYRGKAKPVLQGDHSGQGHLVSLRRSIKDIYMVIVRSASYLAACA